MSACACARMKRPVGAVGCWPTAHVGPRTVQRDLSRTRCGTQHAPHARQPQRGAAVADCAASCALRRARASRLSRRSRTSSSATPRFRSRTWYSRLACDVQRHATRNGMLRATACSTQRHATRSMRHTEYITQHATPMMQHATRSMQPVPLCRGTCHGAGCVPRAVLFVVRPRGMVYIHPRHMVHVCVCVCVRACVLRARSRVCDDVAPAGRVVVCRASCCVAHAARCAAVLQRVRRRS
jgi:hypothetical protein